MELLVAHDMCHSCLYVVWPDYVDAQGRVQMKPHKHAELIKRWADGKQIQFKNSTGNWRDVLGQPNWDNDELRIKPEPEYPKTKMNDDELITAWENGPSSLKLTAVANAAIARAIEDKQVIITLDQIEG